MDSVHFTSREASRRFTKGWSVRQNSRRQERQTCVKKAKAAKKASRASRAHLLLGREPRVVVFVVVASSSIGLPRQPLLLRFLAAWCRRRRAGGEHKNERAEREQNASRKQKAFGRGGRRADLCALRASSSPRPTRLPPGWRPRRSSAAPWPPACCAVTCARVLRLRVSTRVSGWRARQRDSGRDPLARWPRWWRPAVLRATRRRRPGPRPRGSRERAASGGGRAGPRQGRALTARGSALTPW